MAKQFAADLEVNAAISSPFVVREKSLSPFRRKTGKFLNLTLGDCTGQVPARMWDNAEEVASGFDVGDILLVAGHVEEYQGQLQVIVSDLAIADPADYDAADLVAHAGRSREQLLQWLDATVAEVSDPYLRALVDSFVVDPEFRDRLSAAHGSKTLHHAVVGGLLEHTLSVVAILKTVHELHPEMDLDLLIVGGILHDIGKLEELEGHISARYTDVGHLIGHTVLTDRMVGAKMAEIPGFPTELASLLAHLLLSHHGEREWGAPVVPMTMEACALHYADNLDARVQGFKQVIQDGQGSTTRWSAYHRSYQRSIYLGALADEREEGGPVP